MLALFSNVNYELPRPHSKLAISSALQRKDARDGEHRSTETDRLPCRSRRKIAIGVRPWPRSLGLWYAGTLRNPMVPRSKLRRATDRQI
jgi:hypothetical protein